MSFRLLHPNLSSPHRSEMIQETLLWDFPKVFLPSFSYLPNSIGKTSTKAKESYCASTSCIVHLGGAFQNGNIYSLNFCYLLMIVLFSFCQQNDRAESVNDLQIIYSMYCTKDWKEERLHASLKKESHFLFYCPDADKLGRHKMSVNAFHCISSAASKTDSNIKGEDKGLI